MKQGKIILSAASLLLTVAGIFAFKSNKKITGAKQCYTFSNARFNAVAGCVTLHGHTQNANCTTNQLYTKTGTIYNEIAVCTLAQ